MTFKLELQNGHGIKSVVMWSRHLSYVMVLLQEITEGSSVLFTHVNKQSRLQLRPDTCTNALRPTMNNWAVLVRFNLSSGAFTSSSPYSGPRHWA